MNDNRRAMVTGAFVGDALALGAHWVYNTDVIDKKFGKLDHYADPLASYHAGKKAGDLTHYGDQMVVLLESLAKAGRFDGEHFARQWQAFFKNYDGYFDKATKTTLQQMDEGKGLLDSGSSSDDLAGAARIAPVIYACHGDGGQLDENARLQTAITHNNDLVVASAAYFGALTAEALRGRSPSANIEAQLSDGTLSGPMADLCRRGVDSKGEDTRSTIAAFGQTCSVEAALPGTIHLICTHENSFELALVENVMAGGDSAARGMLLGMVLGAYAGMDGIPDQWVEALNQRRHIARLLDALDAA